MAVLVACAVKLRSQVDALNQDRDRSSDGWIGNPEHAGRESDHNPDETGNVPIEDADKIDEVHAIDIDETGPWPGGWSLMVMVRTLVEECRSGREKRIRYIIYERTIWSASWGWGAREYTGSNPHDKHAHLSFSYDTALENDTRPFNIGLDDMPTVTEIWSAAWGEGDRRITAGQIINETLNRVRYLDGRMEALWSGSEVIKAQFPGAGTSVWIVKAINGLIKAVGQIDEEVAAQLADELEEVRKAAAAEVARDAADMARDVQLLQEVQDTPMKVFELMSQAPADEAVQALIAALGEDRAKALFEAGVQATSVE